jgi:Fe-S cluster assembly protein SufD
MMSETITATQAPDRYLDTFEHFSRGAATQLGWLKALRQEGFARFSETGFPTTHDEDWRFTNISAIAQTPFEIAPRTRIKASDLDQFGLAGFECLLVFVNGRYSSELSHVPNLGTGVKVTSLAEQISTDAAAVEKHLGQYLNIQRDSFAALNTAFIEDGVYVHVARNTALKTPIYVLYVSAPGGSPVMDHPRNLIVVEESAEATVVEDYVSLGEGSAFSNAVTEVVAESNAIVSHYMLVRAAASSYNVSTLRIQQARSSNVSTHSLLLSGSILRNNVHPVLAGEGGECLINGLFMVNSGQTMDNYMLVEHAAPHCASRQFYNGVLNGQGHGVFHGRIIVHKDAQKTDAKQTNRNLLLSDDAQIDTKPQLEIYADDVKCTHGATIGQVEENALFYLRSRGLDEAAAKHLLLLAFANECLDRMNSEQMRAYIEALVMTWLPDAARYVGAKPSEVERSLEEVG